MEVIADGSGGADTDDGFHAEEAEELLSVKGEGRDAHPGTHDGHFLSLIGSRIAEHVPHGVELYRVFKISLRDDLRAQRVSG